MTAIRIELGEPAHGWLDVGVRAGNDEVRCVSSYVIDSVSELVSAALELVEQRPVRPVIWFEEPGATRWSFGAAGERIALSITRHTELAAAQRGEGGTPMLAAVVARVPLARAIWTAVRRLEGALGRERIEAGWQRRYPAKEVAQLGEALRSRPDGEGRTNTAKGWR